jgi:hypothetical protein
MATGAPDARRSGLARTLYVGFFELARREGRREGRRSPVPGDNGPGTSLVVFECRLARREMS